MSTNNPFAKHTSSLFGSRGCDIDQALTYAHEVMSALSVEQDKTAMMTAIMVVVNTAANAWTQSQGPSPEKLAVMDLIRNEIDRQLAQSEGVVLQALDDRINNWMEEHLEEKLDDWAGSGTCAFEDNVDERVERWITNNLDISDKIEEAINDMDLVVRVR